MGVHYAPRSSSHAARLAGRGALTAAAALALAGGTASMAFASQVPSVPTTQDIAGHAKSGTHDLQNAAKKAPLPSGSHASDVSGAMKQHASEAKGKASDAASAMKADGEHVASNTTNDAQHAATNWAGAAKGGVTASEASHQFGLMSNDVTHAADNGKADMTQLGSLSS